MTSENTGEYRLDDHLLTTSEGVGDSTNYGHVHVAEIPGADSMLGGKRTTEDFRRQLGEAYMTARRMGRIVVVAAIQHGKEGGQIGTDYNDEVKGRFESPTSAVVVISEQAGIFGFPGR